MALTQYPSFNLTPKQRAFASHYIETGSAPEAAMRAYDCSNRNSARVIAHRNLRNPKVQAYLQEQLMTRDMVDKGLRKLNEKVHAKKKFYAPDVGTIDVADNSARLKALDMYFKLLLKLSEVEPEQQQPAPAQDEEDTYWAMRYEHEYGKKPTPDELQRYREAVDVVPEELQIRLFSTKKRLVSFNPDTFVDE